MTDVIEEEPSEGWGETIYGPMWHYFIQDRSLCRRYEWLPIGGRKLALACEFDKCKACETKKAARDTRALKGKRD